MKDETKKIAHDLKKIKDAIEKFSLKYAEKLPEELAIYAIIAIIKDRGIFIEKVRYDLNELSLNATSIEKHLIAKKLADKYRARDKDEQKEQKKLINKQIKDIRNGKSKIGIRQTLQKPSQQSIQEGSVQPERAGGLDRPEEIRQEEIPKTSR